MGDDDREFVRDVRRHARRDRARPGVVMETDEVLRLCDLAERALEADDGWVDTDERLPGNEETVLVVEPDGVSTATFHDFDDRRFFEGTHLSYTLDEVDGWKPLPEPPDGGGC